ncbi:12596_t:CDS:2 [Ambispora gerdemannii]|uniref:12596_t:CDS:1 n=1 Tax=Ambispora gerdemannii TaxID=144530 RepID=A0A9N8YT28_9GLOM|nr:12596_t:CDS:2 [Ambispora gerdemannii]
MIVLFCPFKRNSPRHLGRYDNDVAARRAGQSILYDRFGGRPQLQSVFIGSKRNSSRHLGRYENDVAARGAGPSVNDLSSMTRF